MRVLVAGGAGYIGSVVAQELCHGGHEVTVFDNLVKGHREAVDPRATFIAGDLADSALLKDTLKQKGIEVVMHFAAHSLVAESVVDPAKYYRNNVSNTINVLEAMLEVGVKKFVFSSTAAIFGQPEVVPIVEDAPYRPTNPYGETKLAVEKLLRWYDEAYQLRYTCLRYFNAAGASPEYGEDHAPESHIIPVTLQAAQGKRETMDLFGTDYPTPDGTCVRDYIHVIDLAQAHILAMQALTDHSHVYNLGSGEGFSNRQVIETVQKVTGRQLKIVEKPRRAGDPAMLIASSARIRAELGWQPRFPELASIIQSAWTWHQAHPNGYAADLSNSGGNTLVTKEKE